MTNFNYEILEHSLTNYTTLVMVTTEGSAAEKWIYVEYYFEVDESAININVSKGPSTYVDYGEQSVEYDNGISVDSVDAKEAVSLSKFIILDSDEEKEISIPTAATILGCTKTEMSKEIDQITSVAINNFTNYFAEWYSENADFDPYDWMNN